MVELGNNTKVMLTRYSNNVIIDDIGGELLLYNHNDLFTFSNTVLLNTHIFTGVCLEYADKVITMNIKDFYDKPIDYIVYNNYVFVEKIQDMSLNEPICVVGFFVKNPSFISGQLYAHFIEKNN